MSPSWANNTISRITLDKAVRARRQLGDFDKTILCADCDRDLGRRYDEYAFEVLTSFDKKHRVLPNNVFEILDVDGERLAKFVLSLLWRASISSLDEYRTLTLGDFEDAARDVLFSSNPLSSIPHCQVMIHRYTSRYFNQVKFFSNPVKSPNIGSESYGFSLVGFRIMATFDYTPNHHESAHFAVNGNTTLRGFFLEIESTPEFQRMKEMTLREVYRKLETLWKQSQGRRRLSNVTARTKQFGIRELTIMTDGNVEIWDGDTNAVWKLKKPLSANRQSILLE